MARAGVSNAAPRVPCPGGSRDEARCQLMPVALLAGVLTSFPVAVRQEKGRARPTARCD